MKKILFAIILLFGLIGIAFWQHENIPWLRNLFHHTMESVQYTCPMHPQVIQDKPGNCPICGMTLVPIEKKPEHKHSEGALFIDPKRLQLIGVRNATVAAKALTRELRLPGRVAYDQESFITEQEYVEAYRLGISNDILKTIENKLVRLGISAEELAQLRKSKRADTTLYLPKAGENFWVYANVYESDLSWVKPGMKAVLSLPKDAAVVLEGEVKQVAPLLDPMTRTAVARILVSQPEVLLKPETYLDVILKEDLGKMLAVPADAVIETGTQQIVLVDLKEGYLEPREVKLGLKAKEDYPVLEGLSEGEIVLTSAHFLIDSEAALQAALKRFGGEVMEHKH